MIRSKQLLFALSVLLLFSTLTILLSACSSNSGAAEEPVTEEDYKRAESFLSSNTRPLVSNTISSVNWLDDGRVIYQRSVGDGSEFVLANPETVEKSLAFDHGRLAESLNDLTENDHSPHDLPFRTFEFSEDGDSILFSVQGELFRCSLNDYSCESGVSGINPFRSGAAISPDGTKEAFIRDYNLWIRNTQTGEDTQLTTDGVENYGYATNNAGWTQRDTPVLLWSPDSQRIATFRHDSRNVGEMYLVSTAVGHSELEQWKYPLPGDEHIFMIERVVINLNGSQPELVRFDMQSDAHRSTITDHVAGRDGTFLDVEWSSDSNSLAFVSSSRDHKQAHLQTTNPNTGAVTSVLTEEEETFFESGIDGINWRYLPESNEAFWFSQRENWGHLYLYNLETGELKNQITEGEWNVREVLHTDTENRIIYFTGSVREEGDPYFEYLYKVSFDGSGLTLLTPGEFNHDIELSVDAGYLVDTYSTPDIPPVSVIRDLDGNEIMELERADTSELTAAGWQPPVPFSVKARDGETDLYGLMYKPTNFDASQSYPVLNYLYPGPQSGSVRGRSFTPSRSDKQALAELGFIVVEVDAMGTPGRSKEFHEFYYGNMGDNGIPDQITTIEQLADRHSWMDVSRVGIFGHSGGGFASTRAILEYPDFYDVAVSGAGNHDNRNYADDWGEKWHGLLVENEDGTTNYDSQANQLLAENLKGKLLLTHGTLDNNVPPFNTLLVIDALIEANKDFDMIMFPNRRHGYYSEPYMMRKRWDYFVRHLKNTEPPKEFEFGNE
jgi:dipeptidyl aminopeptidase/acylaminoacyl peptidase